jgi:SMI1 / KNR4 family (SUKH-1)
MSSSAGLLETFRWADHGADEGAIGAAQAELGVAFPNELVKLLQAHDGGVGWVGDRAYVQLWAVEEIVEYNPALEAELRVPGVLLFGSDGGDGLYGVRTNGDSQMYFKFPAVGLSADVGRSLGESWDMFLNALATPS